MKYSKDLVQDAVSKSKSVTDVMKILGIRMAGGSHSHLSRTIKKYEIDTSHFLGRAYNKGKKFGYKKTSEDIFNSSPDYRLKSRELNRALLESGVEYKCVECGIGSTYNNKSITLQVDHIDGDWKNNIKDNLRFLCPNCHSQTSTYCNKNKICGSGVTVAASLLESDDVSHRSSTLLSRTCINCSKEISKTAERCKSCAASKLHEKTCKRPSNERLQLDLLENDNNLCAIGRKYSVSDNAVRKWIKFYKG